MRSHLVRVEHDLAPLGRRAQAACSCVLDAIEHAPTAVRRRVHVELNDGDLFVVARGWRLQLGADNEHISVSVVASPSREVGRRRAIASAHLCAHLESELWLAWILYLITSRGSAWLTLRAFHLGERAGRKAA